jgi:hypothetical protein
LPDTELQRLFREAKVQIKFGLGVCGNSPSRVSERISGKQPFKKRDALAFCDHLLSAKEFAALRSAIVFDHLFKISPQRQDRYIAREALL